MQRTSTRTVMSVISDFLAMHPTDEEIIAYRLPDDIQERAHELLDRNSQDALTPDEREEMYDIMRVDDMMSLLKTKTRLQSRTDV